MRVDENGTQLCNSFGADTLDAIAFSAGQLLTAPASQHWHRKLAGDVLIGTAVVILHTLIILVQVCPPFIIHHLHLERVAHATMAGVVCVHARPAAPSFRSAPAYEHCGDSFSWLVREPDSSKQRSVFPHVQLTANSKARVRMQAITVNVAVNSKNNHLVGLLISNNFMELKTTVFKSNTTRAHFKLACDDIYERFHLTICLLFVSMEMFSKGGSTSWVPDFLTQVLTLFFFEVRPVLILSHSEWPTLSRGNSASLQTGAEFLRFSLHGPSTRHQISRSSFRLWVGFGGLQSGADGSLTSDIYVCVCVCV
jgi:hypothetical protein